MQWASVNMLYQKRYKTDIFNKSAFANRKLIVIYLLFYYYYFFDSFFILDFR